MLAQFDPDPIRYALTINMPETRDTDFSMSEFIRRNNDELVATYGNLVHRSLSFLQRYMDGKVPEMGPDYQGDQRVIERIDETFKVVGNLLEGVQLQGLAEGSDEPRPVREPLLRGAGLRGSSGRRTRRGCAVTMYECLRILDSLKILTYPYLPHSAEKLHGLLGYEGEILEQGWGPSVPPQGRQLPEPSPLFTKLEPIEA